VGNRSDLAIDEGRRVAERFKASAFLAVPCGSGLVVRQDRNRSVDDVTQVRLERTPALPFGEPPASEGELVPDGRSNGALRTVLIEMLENR